MDVVMDTKYFLDYRLINNSNSDILTFFRDNDTEIKHALQNSLGRFGSIKANFLLDVVLSKYTP